MTYKSCLFQDVHFCWLTAAAWLEKWQLWSWQAMTCTLHFDPDKSLDWFFSLFYWVKKTADGNFFLLEKISNIHDRIWCYNCVQDVHFCWLTAAAWLEKWHLWSWQVVWIWYWLFFLNKKAIWRKHTCKKEKNSYKFKQSSCSWVLKSSGDTKGQ